MLLGYTNFFPKLELQQRKSKAWECLQSIVQERKSALIKTEKDCFFKEISYTQKH